MRGSAWIVLLILLILAAGIAGSLLADCSTSRPADDTPWILDAGLTRVRRALWIYRADGSYPWDRILQDHAALPLEPNERTRVGGVAGRLDDAPPRGSAGHSLGVSSPCGSGSFYAVVRDNDDLDGDLTRDSDGRVLVFLTASTPSGGRSRLEALLEFDPGTATLAVRSLRPLP